MVKCEKGQMGKIKWVTAKKKRKKINGTTNCFSQNNNKTFPDWLKIMGQSLTN